MTELEKQETVKKFNSNISYKNIRVVMFIRGLENKVLEDQFSVGGILAIDGFNQACTDICSMPETEYFCFLVNHNLIK